MGGLISWYFRRKLVQYIVRQFNNQAGSWAEILSLSEI